jgi:peptide/nickel transport system substrate-binding protein
LIPRLAAAALGLLLTPAAAGAPAAPTNPAVLRVCDDVVAPVTLDPRKQFSEKNYTIIRQIFDGLVRFDPEGRITPALAISWKRLDPLTMEFKLRQGVRFQNGEPFDAEAVRFSIQSLIDPRTGFPGAGFLNSLDSVEAVDPATIRVKTKFPDGILLNRLASLVTILPPRYIAEHGADYFGSHPVGTGAFRFTEWDRKGGRIVLSANEGYWEKGYPKIGTLEFFFVAASEQVEMLLNGRLDLVTELPGTSTMEVAKSTVAHVVKKEGYYTVASSLNTKTGPLADVRVRQALNYAVNKDLLVRYDLLGNGRPLATTSMPGEVGHNPDLKPYPYDPAKARRLLREAGYPDGFHLRALVKVQGTRTMKIIAEQLSRVGVRVDIDWTTDGQALYDMTKRPWDWIFAGCPDPMSHSYFVQFIFLSSLSPFSVTRDPRFDELLAGMIGTLDPAEHQRKGMELDAYVYRQALSLFTYQRLKTYGVRNGVVFVPWINGMPLFYLSEVADAKAAR